MITLTIDSVRCDMPESAAAIKGVGCLDVAALKDIEAWRAGQSINV